RQNETFSFADDPKTEVKQPQKNDHAQQLLDWLQKWPKPTIRAADILIYGPTPTRKRKNANDATETLVRHGWLAPLQAQQENYRSALITQKNIVPPQLADYRRFQKNSSPDYFGRRPQTPPKRIFGYFHPPSRLLLHTRPLGAFARFSGFAKNLAVK